MLIKRLWILLLVIPLSLNTCFAQEEEEEEEEEKPKIIIKDRPKKPVVRETLPIEGHRLLIKASLFRGARGEFPLTAEYNLNSKFSVEAGIGVTFKDYLSLLWFEGIGSESVMPENLPDGARVYYPMQYGALYKTSFTGLLKYYPQPDDLLDGHCISLYFHLRSNEYKMRIEETSNSNTWGGQSQYSRFADDGKVRTREIGLIYSYQTGDPFVWEPYIGFGFRSYKADYVYSYRVGSTSNPGPYLFGTGDLKVSYPTVFAGVKAGLEIFRSK